MDINCRFQKDIIRNGLSWLDFMLQYEFIIKCTWMDSLITDCMDYDHFWNIWIMDITGSITIHIICMGCEEQY